MKYLLSLFFLIIITVLPDRTFAQDKFEVVGVWTGEIFNDSTQKYIPFELVISNKNGVFSGYTYTVFEIDSVENIGVKEVTVQEKNGGLVIKDKKLIDDNYTDRPAKGVYTTLELEYSQNDTAEILSGRWFTNKTKKFYPLSGTVSVSRKKRIYESRIIQRLSYLGLANSLSFMRPGYVPDAVAINKPKEERDDEDMITVVEPEFVIELLAKDSESILLPDVGELADILNAMKDTSANEVAKNDISKKNNEKPAVVQDAAFQKNQDKKPDQPQGDKSVVKPLAEQPGNMLANKDRSTGEKDDKKSGLVSEAVTQNNLSKNKTDVTTAGKEVAVVKTEEPLPEKKVEQIQPVKKADEVIVQIAGKSDSNKIVPAAKENQKVVVKEMPRHDSSVTAKKIAASSDKDSSTEPAYDKAEIAKEAQSRENNPVEKLANQIQAVSDVLETESKRADKLEAISKQQIKTPEDLVNRKIETIQSVDISGDSIVLSLYDNGIIDGDTVSILLNDRVIVSKVGLLATAYNHTVHLTPEMGDSIKIILYAENLGSIPPNTGLLIIHDGKRDHKIRFSGDMQNNSAIILRRNRIK